MDLMRFEHVGAFLVHAEPLLLQHEAEHNLMLGICSTLLSQPDSVEHAPYLAIVRDGHNIVAATLMTPPRNVILSLVSPEMQAPEALALIARDLRDVFAGQLPGVMGPVGVSRTFAEQWHALTGQSYHLTMRERIYQVDAVVPITGVPGQFRQATQADREVLVRWIDEFTREAFGGREPLNAERWADSALASAPQGGGVCLWEDGDPVTMAGYGGPTPNGIRIGPVYTPPERRGRGYASACTAALSQRLLDGDRRFCFLFTDMGNPTANHIYQAIGYRAISEANVFEFGAQSPV